MLNLKLKSNSYANVIATKRSSTVQRVTKTERWFVGNVYVMKVSVVNNANATRQTKI